jgi:hypothetical protein
VWPRREQVLQLGLLPSHFNFRFRQIMQARRLGLGTLELPPAGASTVKRSPSDSCLSAAGSDTIMVSGGVEDEDDMAVAAYCVALTASLSRSIRRADADASRSLPCKTRARLSLCDRVAFPQNEAGEPVSRLREAFPVRFRMIGFDIAEAKVSGLVNSGG